MAVALSAVLPMKLRRDNARVGETESVVIIAI
jgi:hypothetical protein